MDWSRRCYAVLNDVQAVPSAISKVQSNSVKAKPATSRLLSWTCTFESDRPNIGRKVNLCIHSFFMSRLVQEGQHPLTRQRAANIRLLANQWAERRLVTQWRHGCRAIIIFLGDHDFPLTGSNFRNLTAFRAIFNHIFTAHAQEWPFMNFRLKFWHHHSIPWSRFPYMARYFGDTRTFSVDFCIAWAECPPYFYFRSSWPTDQESVSRDVHLAMTVSKNSTWAFQRAINQGSMPTDASGLPVAWNWRRAVLSADACLLVIFFTNWTMHHLWTEQCYEYWPVVVPQYGLVLLI